MSRKDFIAGYKAALSDASLTRSAGVTPGMTIDEAMEIFQEWFVGKEGREPSDWYDVTKVFVWLAENGILSVW